MFSDDLVDDNWVAVISEMDAPLVGQERLTSSLRISSAIK